MYNGEYRMHATESCNIIICTDRAAGDGDIDVARVGFFPDWYSADYFGGHSGRHSGDDKLL
jgi:hypothetical protein